MLPNMLNLDKKIVFFVALSFAFQLMFPQYSYAHGLDIDLRTTANQSQLALANLAEPIIFDAQGVNSIVPESLPPANWREPVRKMRIMITAYSSTVDQCDGDPFTTANGSQVKDGIVAANFLPFGTKVKIPEYFGDKIFSVEDRMNQRYFYNLDVWMETRAEARTFGVRYLEVEIYE